MEEPCPVALLLFPCAVMTALLSETPPSRACGRSGTETAISSSGALCSALSHPPLAPTADCAGASSLSDRRLNGHQVSVVIPALNEAESIGFALREMPWDLIHECVVVDNGSSDGTAAEAGAAGARVVSEPRRGYGRACRTGAEAADARSDILVFM